MTIQVPNRVSLAITPTPLQYLERTSAALGVEFYIKRDDMTGLELSGNKVRKLEFLFADAIDKGANVVITGGGEQSNHCRATAMAAAKLGLASVVCLRTSDKTKPPKTSGNILLDRLAGAEIVWIDHDDWARQDEVYELEAERQRERGKIPYIIPEGGSNAIGAWGYIECCRELAEQLGELRAGQAQDSAQDSTKTSVVYACGSGGTGAGLVLGAKIYDFDSHQAQIIGFNVCDDAEFFVQRIHRICEEVAIATPSCPTVERSSIDMIDGYVGRGYAQSSPAELECLRDMARRDAILFDPVYTGKAFFGLVSELSKNPEKFGERVVFIHTGGVFGLFPQADEFDGLL